MIKENDMVLNLLANQNFGVQDFQSVGLTADNTGLRSENEYKKSKTITENELFQDSDGNFNEAKFHKFYLGAAAYYNALSNTTYEQNVLDSAVYSLDNMWVDKDKRKIDFSPKLVRTPNEYLVTSSLESIGKKGLRTRSISEIAQTLKVYNTETKLWSDSPNDSFFENFDKTLVLATYDEDTVDPETGVLHRKGENKLNENGVAYYETLGNRSVYGKQVLNKMNVLTTDGSFANKFDFFDSDDIGQKSIGGTILKNAALVGTMFIPYVGPWVIAASVGSQTLGLLGTLGKVLTGSDNISMFNDMEGWAKTVNRQTATTEYAAENTWCVENFINLIGDTIGLLAEQRLIFKAGQVFANGSKGYKALSGRGYEQLVNEEAKKIEKNWGSSEINKLIADIKDGNANIEGIGNFISSIKDLSHVKAVNYVDNLIKEGNNIASPLAKAYMTAITVQDTYGEAKAAGASDVEASILTLGYASAEAALLNTGVGEWIMPELHGDKFRRRAIMNALTNDIRASFNNGTRGGKKQFFNKVFNIGKKIAENEYATQTGLKVVLAHGAGEGFEEVSEELLADMSKSTFNLYRWLNGEDKLDMGQWDNILDRYGMSAIGGFIGGGITSAATDFSVTKNLSKMDKSKALQEIIYMVNNDLDTEFIKAIDKMLLGDKNLSATNIIEKTNDGVIYGEGTKEDNLDKAVKDAVKEQIRMVRNILNTEGARISTQSLMSKLCLEDLNLLLKNLRLSALVNCQSIGLYLLDFQNILSEIVATKSLLLSLDESKPDHVHDTDDVKKLRKDLEDKLDTLRERVEKYKNGEMAPLFILDALFEMNPLINRSLVKTNLILYAEARTKKKWKDLSELERKDVTEEFKNYYNTTMKDDIHKGSLILVDMITLASNPMQDTMTKAWGRGESINKLNGYLLSILASRANIDPNDELFDLESTLGEIQTWVDVLNEATGFNALISEEAREKINTIQKTPTSDTYNETQKAYDIKSTLVLDLIDHIEGIVNQYVSYGYIDPESKRSLNGILNMIRNYAFSELTQNGNLNPADIQKYTSFVGGPQSTYNMLYYKINGNENLGIRGLYSSPILSLIESFQLSATNSDVNFKKHLEDTYALFDDHQDDVGEFTVDSTWTENNEEALKIIDTFIAITEAMKTDNADFNNPTGFTKILNDINLKYNKNATPYFMLDTQDADLILLDAITIKNRLLYAKKLDEINKGSKIRQLDKVGLNTHKLFYNSFERFSKIIPDDWNGKNELIQLINDGEQLKVLKEYVSDPKKHLSKEERLQLEKEEVQLQDAINDFFLKNANADGTFDVDKLSKLLKNFAGKQGFFQKTNGLLTEKTESIADNLFIWWLAGRAVLKSSSFYGAYKTSIENGTIAPIFSQELGVYLGVAALTNMNALNSFVDAYKKAITDSFNEASEDEKRLLLNAFKPGEEDFANKLLKYFGGHDIVPNFHNMLLFEGAPGTGKSGGIFASLHEIAKVIDPEITKNALYVHNTLKNAENALKDIKFDEAVPMDKTALMKYITPDYKDANLNKTNGEVFLYEDSYEFDQTGKLVNKWRINTHPDGPKIIFIDEIGQYNALELSAIEQYAQLNGVIVFTAGDTDQNIQEASLKIPEAETPVSVRLGRNLFITIPKLGVSLRTANTLMTLNQNMMQAAMRHEGNVDLKLKYLDNDELHKGLFGIKTINTDGTNYSAENLTEMEKTILLMVDTLAEGEKIGYIYDNENTPLYKLINEKFKDKVNLYKGTDAQGLESQYYIIENDQKAPFETYKRALYTGISRAKQGGLAIVSNEKIGNWDVSSVKDNKYSKEEFGKLAKEHAIKTRTELLEYILENVETEALKYKKPNSSVQSTSQAQPSTQQAPAQTLPAQPNSPVPPGNPFVLPSYAYNTEKDANEAIILLVNQVTTIPNVRAYKNTSNDEFFLNSYDIKEENDGQGNKYFVPYIILFNNGVNTEVRLDTLQSEYTIKSKTILQIAQLYLLHDKFTIEQNGVKTNIELTSYDPSTGIYETLDLDTNTQGTISLTDLQNSNPTTYEPLNSQPRPETSLPDVDEEVDGILEFNAELDNDDLAHVEFAESHCNLVHTFNTYEIGNVEADENGKAKFKYGLDEFDARIDSGIGLMKLGIDDYDTIVKTLASIRNLFRNVSDDTVLAKEIGRLLGQSDKTINIRYGIKSSSGNRNTSEYMRYTVHEAAEDLRGILAEKTPARKKLVAIIDIDNKHALEIPLATFSNPITIIKSNKLYKELADFYDANSSRGDYPAFTDMMNKFKGVPEYKNIFELIKFYLYSSNGFMYIDNFNLARNLSLGPQIVIAKTTEHNPKYDFVASLTPISNIIENSEVKISSIFASKDGKINGKVVAGLKPGYTFVLISDDQRINTDDQMVLRFIQLQNDPLLPKVVKIKYVVPPRSNVKEWLENSRLIYLNATGQVGQLYDIGTKFTGYQILKKLIDLDKFDQYNFYKGITDKVKAKVELLKTIEDKWTWDNIQFSDSQEELEYKQKVSETTEYQARKYMRNKQMLDILESTNDFNYADIGGNKNVMKAFNQILINMVWLQHPSNHVVFLPSVLEDISLLCENVDIYYKALYSPDNVGPFIKIQTLDDGKNKYSLNSTASSNAEFSILAKIDSSPFLINDLPHIIETWNKNAYFNRNHYAQRNKADDADYRGNPQPVRPNKVVSQKYQRLIDSGIIKKSWIENLDTEKEILLNIAKKYNKSGKGYGFIFNDKLYLTSKPLKLSDNTNIEITDSSNSYTITEENGTEHIITFDVDSNGFIVLVNDNISEVKLIDVNQASINLTPENILTIFDQYQAKVLELPLLTRSMYYPLLNQCLKPIIEAIQNSQEDIDTFIKDTIENYRDNGNCVEDRINKAIELMEGNSEVVNLLTQIKRYFENEPIVISSGDRVKLVNDNKTYEVINNDNGEITLKDESDLMITTNINDLYLKLEETCVTNILSIL